MGPIGGTGETVGLPLDTDAATRVAPPSPTEAAWDLVSNDPNSARWRRRFRARSATGSSQPSTETAAARKAPHCVTMKLTKTLTTSLLRSAFAPD